MQNEFRSKKRRAPRSVAETDELAEVFLWSADVPVNAVTPLEVPVSMGGNTPELAAELDKGKVRNAKLESIDTITVPRDGELLNEVKQRLAKGISVWKEIPAENLDSLIKNVKFAKADSVKISVESNLIFAGFKEHVCALQVLVIAKMERKVVLSDAMRKLKDLLESGYSIQKSDCSVKI